MRQLSLATALAAALALAACKEKAPAPPPPAKPAAPGPYAYTLRDLALATAVDARLARLSLAGSEIEAALAARDARARAKAKDGLPALETALAGAGPAVEAVAHPLDRPAAARVGKAARDYAERLAAAARAPDAPLGPELAAAREELGAALSAYRQSRVAWRIEGPEPQGAEREFAEARRDMERAETGFMSRTRVAPREEGHEFDAAGARMAGRMGVQRARAAAGQLPAALAPHAGRYAEAQEKVLEAVEALQASGDADRPRLARAYHAAKADALAALADYFSALASR